MLPLQAGVPGGPELIIILFIFGLLVLVPLAVAAFVYRDANSRGSSHALAWAAGTFFSGILGGLLASIVVLVLYFVVRDEIGPANGGA